MIIVGGLEVGMNKRENSRLNKKRKGSPKYSQKIFGINFRGTKVSGSWGWSPLAGVNL